MIMAVDRNLFSLILEIVVVILEFIIFKLFDAFDDILYIIINFF